MIIHTTPDALRAGVPAGTPVPGEADVPAGTPGPRTPGHPCRPGRCHLDDGPAISAADAQLIACDATVSTMTHGLGIEGTILNVGRRTRKATAAIRRAVRERDGSRCTFPGCDSRRTDLHHIQWWSNGGETSLENLQPLCKAHHRLVHQKSYIITRGPGGSYTFTSPATGTTIGPAGPLPEALGAIGSTHTADITPATIQQARGERLDLHYAIWVALHNGRNPRSRSRRFYNIPEPDQDQPAAA